jgi:hypothetical protein
VLLKHPVVVKVLAWVPWMTHLVVSQILLHKLLLMLQRLRWIKPWFQMLLNLVEKQLRTIQWQGVSLIRQISQQDPMMTMVVWGVVNFSPLKKW